MPDHKLLLVNFLLIVFISFQIINGKVQDKDYVLTSSKQFNNEGDLTSKFPKNGNDKFPKNGNDHKVNKEKNSKNLFYNEKSKIGLESSLYPSNFNNNHEIVGYSKDLDDESQSYTENLKGDEVRTHEQDANAGTINQDSFTVNTESDENSGEEDIEENSRIVIKNPEDFHQLFQSLTLVQSQKQLRKVLSEGALQLIIFLYADLEIFKREETEENLFEFFSIFNKAGQYLLSYNITFAIVNCDGDMQSPYCTEEKAGRFAYGFQKHKEKIAFPIETLYNEDSIIASTLHLLLLNSIPIIQSFNERMELEDKYRHKKNILLALHNSLGTSEHRLLLEISQKFRNEFLFTLTTYSSTTHGLPNSPVLKDSFTVDPLIYVLHCSNKRVLNESQVILSADRDPCSIVSHFHGNFKNSDKFQHFLQSFNLPLVNNLSSSEEDELFLYEEYQNPYVLFVYDQKSRDRVEEISTRIAAILRGTVVVLTLQDKDFNSHFENILQVFAREIKSPAVLFYHKQQEKETTRILNDMDNPLPWIYEQLESFKKLRREGNVSTNEDSHPYYELDELQQDDEVELKIIPEESFTNLKVINTEEEFNDLLSKPYDGVIVVAFYVSWDPASNILLQHLELSSKLLKQHKSSSSLHRINCFDSNVLCEYLEVDTFPALKIFGRNRTNITYDGMVETKQLTKTILLIECDKYSVKINSSEGIEEDWDSLILKTNCTRAAQFSNSIVLGIFSTYTESEIFNQTANDLFGYNLLGIVFSEELANEKCTDAKSCVIVFKSNDQFQKSFTIQGKFIDPRSLKRELEFHSQSVFGPLDPENQSIMEFDSECAGGKKIIFILITRTPLSSSNFYSQQTCSKPQLDETETLQEVEQEDCLEDSDLRMFENIGQIASTLAKPGLVFAYSNSFQKLGKELIDTYNLKGTFPHLLSIDRNKDCAYIYKDIPKRTISVHNWIHSVTDGEIEPSVLLPSKEWLPEFEGFNYLDFMEEDFYREADDNLGFDINFNKGSNRPLGEKSLKEN